MTERCDIKGCGEPAVCFDQKGRSWAGLSSEQVPNAKTGIRYCLEHAKEFLFPLIDLHAGNTKERIVQDFKSQGLWSRPMDRQDAPKRRTSPRDSLVDGLPDEADLDLYPTGEEN